MLATWAGGRRVMKMRTTLLLGIVVGLLSFSNLAWGQTAATLQLNPSASGQCQGPSTGAPQYWSQTLGQNPVNNPLLPSQIRYGQMAAGPLAPGGVYLYTAPLGPQQFIKPPAP
jgi:hypothetical protein